MKVSQTWQAGQEDSEIEASLGYRENSKPAWAT